MLLTLQISYDLASGFTHAMSLFFRYGTAEEIPKSYFDRSKELSGIVATVADGDGFRFYHQPLFCCSPPNIPRSALPEITFRVRLAGIDAPEMGHNGHDAQPFAQEARDALRRMVDGRKVTIKLHSIDQYGRVVASAYVRSFWFFRKNLSLELVEAGLAAVYVAQGAQYGGIKDKLMAAQEVAKYPGFHTPHQ